MHAVDLVRYNHAVRALYVEALAKLPWSEVVKPRGISFDSLRNILVHLTMVEDRWVNYIIPDRFLTWVDPSFEDYESIIELKEYVLRTQKRTEEYLNKLNAEELGRKIVIPWGKPPYASVTVETVLTHMIIEDLIHYGELSAILWQTDVEPPYLAFWRYNLGNSNLPQNRT